MSESIPSGEGHKEPAREAVVESLRSNPQDLALFGKYLDVREKRVQTSKDALELNVDVARIYRDAGMTEIAQEAYQDAAEQAF